MLQQPLRLRYRTRLGMPLSLVLSTVFAASAFAQDRRQVGDSKPAAAPQRMHLYLLVGQSNMAGRGRVGPEDKRPISGVFMLTKDLKWKPAVAPLHFDKPAVVGVGVGRSFAKAMRERDADAVIGLIPAAVGGSPIDSWQPGGYHRQTKSHPFDDALKRAKHALKSGELKGILWHQGESDSKPGLAESYSGKLHELIGRLRTSLGATNAPFIVGQMGKFAERPWNESKRLVDNAHRALPDTVARTAFVSSNGLGHKGDQVHFNAKSYRELGRRFAKAMMSLAP